VSDIVDRGVRVRHTDNAGRPPTCAPSPLRGSWHATRVPFEAASAVPARVTIWARAQLNVGSGFRCLAAAPGRPASFAWRRRVFPAFTASRSWRVGPTNPPLAELRSCFQRFANGCVCGSTGSTQLAIG
jgi:hypothetical protein